MLHVQVNRFCDYQKKTLMDIWLKNNSFPVPLIRIPKISHFVSHFFEHTLVFDFVFSTTKNLESFTV